MFKINLTPRTFVGSALITVGATVIVAGISQLVDLAFEKIDALQSSEEKVDELSATLVEKQAELNVYKAKCQIFSALEAELYDEIKELKVKDQSTVTIDDILSDGDVSDGLSDEELMNLPTLFANVDKLDSERLLVTIAEQEKEIAGYDERVEHLEVVVEVQNEEIAELQAEITKLQRPDLKAI